MHLEALAAYVLFVIKIAILVMSIYGLINAGLQRADAYPAAGKMTKNIWLAILGGAVVLALISDFIGLSVMGVAISAVAVGVYLADVRPKLLEVQGKSR